MPLPTFDPSDFRDRLVIKKPPSAVLSQDDHGQPTGAWETVDEVWAQILPIDGQEVYDGDKLLGKVTHAVTFRYHAGVTRVMRGEFDGRTLLFTAVRNPDGMRVLTEVDAVELV